MCPDDRKIIQRENRYSSHALVELKKYRRLPFGVRSAVLLDISLSGFKIEFTAETTARAGEQFWLSIPLTPLGIYAPTRLLCKGEVRWFDEKRYRIGGVFMALSTTDRHIVEQIVETLRERRAATY